MACAGGKEGICTGDFLHALNKNRGKARREIKCRHYAAASSCPIALRSLVSWTWRFVGFSFDYDTHAYTTSVKPWSGGPGMSPIPGLIVLPDGLAVWRVSRHGAGTIFWAITPIG